MDNKPSIIGTGSAVPDRIIDNGYFDELYGRNVSSFLKSKRGISQRRYLEEHQATSDLIIPATVQAMNQAGITAEEVDLLIVATDTPDYISPATAAVVQHAIGAKNAACFDMNAACAGYVSALAVANDMMVAHSKYRHALVVGAYGMSKHIDFEDYKVASLFGDGAGAVVLGRSAEGFGIESYHMATEGQYHDHMGIYAGGTRTPVTSEIVENRQHLLQFRKRIPPETNTERWPDLIRTVLDRAGACLNDVDLFIFTQVNREGVLATLEVLDLPIEKTHFITDLYGYTGSACHPMTLADAHQKGRLTPGDRVMLVASGGGMNLAALSCIWGI